MVKPITIVALTLGAVLSAPAGAQEQESASFGAFLPKLTVARVRAFAHPSGRVRMRFDVHFKAWSGNSEYPFCRLKITTPDGVVEFVRDHVGRFPGLTTNIAGNNTNTLYTPGCAAVLRMRSPNYYPDIPIDAYRIEVSGRGGNLPAGTYRIDATVGIHTQGSSAGALQKGRGANVETFHEAAYNLGDLRRQYLVAVPVPGDLAGLDAAHQVWRERLGDWLRADGIGSAAAVLDQAARRKLCEYLLYTRGFPADQRAASTVLKASDLDASPGLKGRRAVVQEIVTAFAGKTLEPALPNVIDGTLDARAKQW